jgi:hydroxyethylthiazole kinase-like sugar kinase family protein
MVRYREENGKNHALNIERVGSAGSANPTKLAEGKVTSVSASHVTLAADGHDMTFAITGDTDVLVKGASKATKAAGGGTPLTTFVHSGDMVSVSYKDAAGAMTASEIRVRVPNR